MSRRKRKKQKLHAKRQPNQQQSKADVSNPPPASQTISVDQEQAVSPVATDQATNNENQRERPRSTDWAVWLQIIFSACLVLFTLGQVVVGHWQWSATRDQYNAMVEQNKTSAKAIEQTDKTLALMQLDQRPWIEIQIPTIVKNNDTEVYFELNLVNSGKTPAYVQRADCLTKLVPDGKGREVFEKEAFERFNKNDAGDPESVIPPGGTFRIDGSFTKDTTKRREVALIAVKVIYNDTAGKIHISERWYASNENLSAVKLLPVRDKMN